jgi:hypothetical protein
MGGNGVAGAGGAGVNSGQSQQAADATIRSESVLEQIFGQIQNFASIIKVA